jgi:uncharacterized protein (DUF736 family)|tara:strand:+ start:915 stop:1163 length:249 start_codon:yes stop_codon:yes gene_type:complete
MADSNLVEVCALWKQESKAGDMYLSGSLSKNTKVLVLKNSFKAKDNEPDYRVYLAPKDRKPEGETGGGETGGGDMGGSDSTF